MGAMTTKKIDEKQPVENTEMVKEGSDPKRNYIFQKNRITKVGFIIIVIFLLVIIVGIVISGMFFHNPAESLPNP